MCEALMEAYSMVVYRCDQGALHCYSYVQPPQQQAEVTKQHMSPSRHQMSHQPAALDSQRIRDRERELERIHRRSRELMLTSPPNTPANGDEAYARTSRENSMDRVSTTSAASSKASSSAHIRRGPR